MEQLRQRRQIFTITGVRYSEWESVRGELRNPHTILKVRIDPVAEDATAMGVYCGDIRVGFIPEVLKEELVEEMAEYGELSAKVEFFNCEGRVDLDIKVMHE